MELLDTQAMINVGRMWMLLLLSIAGAVQADVERIFTDQSLSDARIAAAEQGRILVVVAVAKDQPELGLHVPTWTNDQLVAWTKAHAVVVKVDREAQADLVEELEIDEFPQVVVFDPQGREMDRLDDDVNAEAVLTLFQSVRAGRTRVDRLTAEFAQARADGKPDPFLRLDLAQALLAEERHAEALPHYVWLWNSAAALDREFAAARFDLLVNDMIYLVDEHPPALGVFRILRDETAERLRGPDKTWADFNDWITLNDVLDDTEATVAWWDKFKDHPAAARGIEKHVEVLEYALTQQGRWPELLRLYPDPVAVVKGARHQLEQSEKHARQWGGEPDEARALVVDHLRDRAATMYAALLAAGREDDARAIVDEAVAADDTLDTKALLVEYALEAQQPRQVHHDWLKAVAADSDWAELKQRLNAALPMAAFSRDDGRAAPRRSRP